MSTLPIFAHINSLYQVFDATGQLPFSVVFGLCRRRDTDSRSLLLETAGSVLDVPYALANDLLILHEQHPDHFTQWIEVDLGSLSDVTEKNAECICLPSPVGRTQRWRDALTVYRCHIGAHGPLASILLPGKKYRIRLAGEDLGVKRFAYGDHGHFADNQNLSSDVKLINSQPTGGNATFKVVKGLPWPPRVETRMQLQAASSPAFDPTVSSMTLEISVTNIGASSITVQTRGHQQYLVEWGPFQPLEYQDDSTRICDPGLRGPPTSSLQVVNAQTGEAVRETKQTGIGPLMAANADRRPKAEYLVILHPRQSVVRNFDIGQLVRGLKDGSYVIKLVAKGCRWWEGEVKEADCENGRVPDGLGRKFGVPLMLQTNDEVEICIKDGRPVQSL